MIYIYVYTRGLWSYIWKPIVDIDVEWQVNLPADLLPYHEAV